VQKVKDSALATHLSIDKDRTVIARKTLLKGLRTLAASALIISVSGTLYADPTFKMLRSQADTSDFRFDMQQSRVFSDIYINQGFSILLKLAKGHDTSPIQLDKLSKFGLYGFSGNSLDDYGAQVREAVAANRNTMPYTLANIIETDPNPIVKNIAKKNPNAQFIL
jgi:hypothetical protein